MDTPTAETPPAPLDPSGEHLATISHEGRFWDVYLEFEDDPRRPTTTRALLCFSPADPADGEGPVRTAVIVIEDSLEKAMRKARQFEDHHLSSLLRSALP